MWQSPGLRSLIEQELRSTLVLNETRLPSSTQNVLEQIRRIGPALADDAHAAEIAGNISDASAASIRATGVQQLLQPEVFGGLETDIESHAYATSVIGEYCMSSAWCASVWGAHNWMLAHWPESVQAEVWAEPDVLVSASILPKTPLARQADGSIHVEGRFDFTSGVDHAGWYGVGALVTAEGEDPRPVITVFPGDPSLIDHDSWKVVGLAGTGSKDLVIEEPITVDADHMVGYEEARTGRSPGLATNTASLYRAPFRPTAALVLAGPGVGAARGAVRRFVERSSAKPGPFTANRIAEASALADAAETVLLQASRDLDYLGTLDEPDPVAAITPHRDTSHAVRLAAQAVNVVFEAAGGNSLRTDEPIQRAWRDATAARNHGILTWDVAAVAYGSAVIEAATS